MFALRVLFVTAFCWACWATAENPNPVKLGVIQGLTGIAAEDGENVLHAIELAADTLNRESSPGVELLIENDETDPKQSISAYQKLRTARVEAVIGSTYGFPTEAVIPLAGKDKVVLLNTSGLLEAFNTESSAGYFFNNTISITEDVKPFVKALANLGPYFTAVLIHTSSKWGSVSSLVCIRHGQLEVR